MTKLVKQFVIREQEDIHPHQQTEDAVLFNPDGTPYEASGTQGPQGPQGPTGSQGIQGPAGVDAFASGIIAASATRVPLSGLSLWLDGSDVTCREGLDPVTKVLDRSGNKIAFGTHRGASYPTIEAQENGLDVFTFDGDGGLAAALATLSFLHHLPSTIFAVAKANANGHILDSRDGVSGSDHGISLALNTSTLKWTVTGSNGLVCEALATSGITGDLQVLSVLSDPANGTAADRVKLYADGTDTTAANSSSAAPVSGNPDRALGFGFSEGANAPFNGEIGEVIVYNRLLTSQERNVVEGYLTRKWIGPSLLPYVNPASITAQQLGQALIDLGFMASS